MRTPSIIQIACRVTVIVNNFAGAGELIKDGENGFHVRAKDVVSWCKTIERAAKLSEDQYAKLSSNARNSVADLTVENFLKDLENLLQ